MLPTPTLPIDGTESNKWGAGIDEPAAPPFTLYPNPTTGELHLSQPLEGGGTVTVRDVAGRVVQHSTLRPGTAAFRLTAAPGLYIVEVQAAGFRHIQRIVVE